MSRSRRRHRWTAELDERLCRTYRAAGDRDALSAGISHFQRDCGYPRSVIVSRAAVLGLAARRGQPWSCHELSALQERAGALPIAVLARRLRRSYYSVKGQLSRLQLRGRFSEGYSQQDLQLLLGVSSRTVRRWLQLKWLALQDGRIPENAVLRFLRRHPEEYQLGRVDEAWFKGLLFPSFNSLQSAERISTSGPRLTPLVESNQASEVLQ